ncbi:hypothetical protein Afil01_52760 [Actinorhabdospora filicis]|uniref:Protein kinase domain-containing protein n=1 Tax=Actinorhabdospora filicis TaxID=1785913 RepID=A0A9W6SR52_9ACTN|nr:serine/threonine-protein kinase [Actinorhabdospora filicis]GLZ80469.1 hypothetical protein Afil01_52760 [Actinorhabdospora filicis]
MSDLLAVLGLPGLWLLQGAQWLLERVPWLGDPPAWIAVVLGAAVLLRAVTLPLWLPAVTGERNELVTAPVRASLAAHRLPREEADRVRKSMDRTHPLNKQARNFHRLIGGGVLVSTTALWWAVRWGEDPGGIGLKSTVHGKPLALTNTFWDVFDVADPWPVLLAVAGGAVVWAGAAYLYKRLLRGNRMPDWALDWGHGKGTKFELAPFVVGGLLFMPFAAIVTATVWTLIGALLLPAVTRRVREPEAVWDRFVEIDPLVGTPRVRPVVAMHPGMPPVPSMAPYTPPPVPPHPNGKALLPGDPHAIGGYQVLGRLGAGGMGTVYLARRPGTSTTVALKTTNGLILDSALERERFQRECDTLALADGPYTARVLDSGVDRNRPFLVTELLDGLTLHDYAHIKGPILEPAGLRSLAIALAEGLRSLHDLGVVHRDIKPANIMLTSDGPKIIDFGIAFIPGSTRLTNTGVQLGTFAFMAPEQFEDSRITAAADVWAWACCVAFAASVKGPFDAESIPRTTHKVISQPPDPEILGRIGAIDPQLGELVTRSLDKVAEKRPADGAALIDGLCPDGRPLVHIARGWRLIAGKMAT